MCVFWVSVCFLDCQQKSHGDSSVGLGLLPPRHVPANTLELRCSCAHVCMIRCARVCVCMFACVHVHARGSVCACPVCARLSVGGQTVCCSAGAVFRRWTARHRGSVAWPGPVLSTTVAGNEQYRPARRAALHHAVQAPVGCTAVRSTGRPGGCTAVRSTGRPGGCTAVRSTRRPGGCSAVCSTGRRHHATTAMCIQT